MVHLLQQHTVALYGLEGKEFTRETVSARSLLTVRRFDFFAKLAYIKYRKTNPQLALKLYTDHIKAFNPDLREPGREDKNGIQDFITAFDHLIDYFETHEFNPEISLIPVDGNGLLLDGSHRVTALAYWDKEVTILRFKDTRVVADFDYTYFRKRGLPMATADRIAWEGVPFTNALHVACLWPKMGNLSQRAFAQDYIRNHFKVFYEKSVTMSLSGLSKFIYETYKEQEWVGSELNDFQGARDKALHCYAPNGVVQFIIFQASSLTEVLGVKDEIREHYKLDKHALHITDSQEETLDILRLILTDKSSIFTSAATRFSDRLYEWKVLFSEVYWINFKVFVAKLLGKVRLYK